MQDWKEIFKWFHRHPEVGLCEKETTAKIREILEEEGIEILESGMETGLIAVIHGAKPGKTVGVRADIDALNVVEASGVDYPSEHPGVMHACGHDFHITSLLAAAASLQARRDELCGKVYLIFQPAEEIVKGAFLVLETGLTNDAEAFLGIHAEPQLNTGEIGILGGPIRAAVDKFKITIKGVGTHAAAPHFGENPVMLAAQLATTLKEMVDRKIAPISPRVFSITNIHGGAAWNVIPETAVIEGTIRSMGEDNHKLINDAMDDIIAGYRIMSGAEITLEKDSGHGSVVNDYELCDLAFKVCEQEGLAAPKVDPQMIGDDFSHFTESGTPGLYVTVGTGKGANLHNPAFKVDLDAIEPSRKFLVAMTEAMTRP